MSKAKSIGIYFKSETLQIVKEDKQIGENVGQCVNRLIQEGRSSAHEVIALTIKLENRDPSISPDKITQLKTDENLVKKLVELFRVNQERLLKKTRNEFLKDLTPEETERIKNVRE